MKTIFIAGYARLPSGMAAQNVYDTLTITAEVDKKYGVIVSTSSTLATKHGRQYVERLLRGHSLQDGVEDLVEHTKNHYLGKAGNAIQSAIQDLSKQYEQYKRT